MKKHNFSAGPCILPQSVFEQAALAVLDFNNSGLSLIEISHRSKPFVEVMERARLLVKTLLNLPEGYSVLFLQGGASLQFVMAPYNLLKKQGKAVYLDTGVWSSGAIKEAQRLGVVQITASSKDKNYIYIPKDYSIDQTADYFHITSNNTIYGTQVKNFPKPSIPMVCDMSSDIFSREINAADFGLIYAGAQKNMGPAGTTLVIVKDELLGKTDRNIPAYLDYQIHINKDSMFNTPSVFSVYVTMLTLNWLKDLGGVSAISKINDKKSQLLYDEIDRNSLFKGLVINEDRSCMNVTFDLTQQANQPHFDALCQQAGISGIKGHRSAGGYRASLYNALPIESVEVLVDVMRQLETQFG